jgi:hypothetical protein
VLNDLEFLIVTAFGPLAARIAAITLGSLIVLFVGIGILKTFQRGK